jgi:hypothetical protein
MAFEMTKLKLDYAESFSDREEAVSTALKQGMPLSEVEAFFDWLDLQRAAGNTLKPNSMPAKKTPAA